MHIYPFGITPVQGRKMKPEDRSYFSDEKYECISLFQTRSGAPVTLSENRDPARFCWRVRAGWLSFYFRTYAEAVAFCRKHYYDLHGEKLQEK